MKTLERVITAAACAGLAWALWRFDLGAVWRQVSVVGWGFALIIPFQLFDQMINALGWRMSFAAPDARRVPFRRLVMVRVAGDGVNYLTPSASVAGEFIRPLMLGDALDADARNTSVVVAKFGQALGQAIFILVGMLLVLRGKLDFLTPAQKAAGFGMAGLNMTFVAVALLVLTRPAAPGARFWQADGAFGPVRALMRRYLRAHPLRFSAAAFFFMLGYAWGALEVLLICRFMGLALPLLTALAVEILSSAIDAIMFMVPGKLGTQELGKVLIFRGLGYAAEQGLAFGLIRHVREVAWAGAGFALYLWHRRRHPRPSQRPLPLPEAALPR